ncbi:unnamed protein product [Ectocarpus sp. 12 AP-2014]
MIVFEPNLSIDISLLAIILGLYVTKNDRNLILLLLCCLFAHVSLTNDDNDDGDVIEHSALGAAAGDSADPGDDQSGKAAAEEDAVVVVADENAANTPRPPDHFKTTLSSGVFDRQLSTPQTNLTSTVFPSTSEEANGKLASARGSFFEALVS